MLPNWSKLPTPISEPCFTTLFVGLFPLPTNISTKINLSLLVWVPLPYVTVAKMEESLYTIHLGTRCPVLPVPCVYQNQLLSEYMCPIGLAVIENNYILIYICKLNSPDTDY